MQGPTNLAGAGGPLDQNREMILRLLTGAGQFYHRMPEAQALLQQLSQRAGGQDSPFTQGTVDRLVGQDASGSAQNLQGEQGLIRQYFANAGLGGSGLEGSALVNARRRASAATRAARRDIDSRASLANYQAREAAQGQLGAYLAQIQQAQQDATFREVEERGKLHATGDANDVLQAVKPAQQTSNQQSPTQPGNGTASSPAPAQGGGGGTDNSPLFTRAQTKFQLAQDPIKTRISTGFNPYTLNPIAGGRGAFRSTPNQFHQQAQYQAATGTFRTPSRGGFGTGGGFA